MATDARIDTAAIAERLGISRQGVDGWPIEVKKAGQGSKEKNQVSALDVIEYLYSRGSDEEDPLKFQRIRLTRADADKRELEVSVMRGEYIIAQEVKERLGFIFTEFRTKVLGLKPLVKVLLPDLSDKDLDSLEKLHKDTLRALDADVLPAAIKASREKVK